MILANLLKKFFRPHIPPFGRDQEYVVTSYNTAYTATAPLTVSLRPYLPVVSSRWSQIIPRANIVYAETL